MKKYLISLSALCVLAGNAAAAMNFNLDVNDLVGTPGGTVTFSGKVTGVNGDVTGATLDALSITGSGTFLNGAFTQEFLDYIALSDSHTQYMGTIATYTIPVGTSAGVYSLNSSATNGQIIVNGVNNRGAFVTDDENISITVQAVPEPTTMAALGFGAVAMLRRRKKA